MEEKLEKINLEDLMLNDYVKIKVLNDFPESDRYGIVSYEIVKIIEISSSGIIGSDGNHTYKASEAYGLNVTAEMLLNNSFARFIYNAGNVVYAYRECSTISPAEDEYLQITIGDNSYDNAYKIKFVHELQHLIKHKKIESLYNLNIKKDYNDEYSIYVKDKNNEIALLKNDIELIKKNFASVIEKYNDIQSQIKEKKNQIFNAEYDIRNHRYLIGKVLKINEGADFNRQYYFKVRDIEVRDNDVILDGECILHAKKENLTAYESRHRSMFSSNIFKMIEEIPLTDFIKMQKDATKSISCLEYNSKLFI